MKSFTFVILVSHDLNSDIKSVHFDEVSLQGWIGRRDTKNFSFFSPSGECLKTRKKMLDSHEFQEASKEEQQMLADFKPQRSISLERGHPERRKTLDDNFKDQSKKPQDPEEPESKGTGKDKSISRDENKMPQNKNGEHSPQDVAKLSSDHNNIVDDPTEKETGIGNVQISSEIARKNLEGWRRTGNRGLISPDGTKFRTKRQAVEQLAKRGGCEVQVEALRDLCVEEDGWTREMLPRGWLGKERDKVLLSFLEETLYFS